MDMQGIRIYIVDIGSLSNLTLLETKGKVETWVALIVQIDQKHKILKNSSLKEIEPF